MSEAPKPAASADGRNRAGLTRADYDGAKTTLCPGCGHNAITAAVIQAAYEAALEPQNVAKLSGIGCSSKTPAYFLGQSHGFNAVHGRMPSIATGVRVANRELLLIGVSYSGFGVATLASHHPELLPDRVIVIDSYLNLVARRSRLPPRHETALEIDGETGGSRAELGARSTSVAGLVRLARSGTRLVVIWSVSEDERREFLGATCNRDANAGTLLQLADAVARPVVAWVTESRHGHDLWNHGAAIVAGRYPGREVTFEPEGSIPPGSVCPG